MILTKCLRDLLYVSLNTYVFYRSPSSSRVMPMTNGLPPSAKRRQSQQDIYSSDEG